MKENWQVILAIFWPDGEWKDNWLQWEPYAAENLLPSLVTLTLLLNRLFPNICFFSFFNNKTFQLMLYYPNWLGRFWSHFIYPYFFSNPPSYCTSQNTSFLVKAFGCSLFSCSHHRNVLPHSPLMSFLTEASSLFLHTAYILSYFSHSSSSALKNPTQCLLLNHLLILVCQNLRH